MQEKADRKIEIHKAYQARRRMVYRSVSRVHREAIIERENRPQLQQLGLFFYRSHAQGEVYPFAGGRSGSDATETKNTVLSSSHTP